MPDIHTFAPGDGIAFRPKENTQVRFLGRVIEANPTCLTFQECHAEHSLWGYSDAELGKIHVITDSDGIIDRYKLTRKDRDALAAIA